ncbi:MAG: hypothetical protein RBJ76_23400 [Stenomitos frigidus ULC029]
MLSQIVRPMVQTQIRLLANSRATRPTMVSTVAHWLGFLGVRAQVTHLDAGAGKIHISISVDKPEACDAHDWQQILHNLNTAQTEAEVVSIHPAEFTPQQQSKMQRLLAYLIQVGAPDSAVNWESLQLQLQALGLSEPMVLGIRSALKVPQVLDGLDSDVAAVALPKAVSIAMLDRQVNASEDQALIALLKAMKHQ